MQRPWWQPYLISVAIGLAWPIVTLISTELASAEARPELVVLLSDVVARWIDWLSLLVPSVLLGAGIGLLVSGLWGIRHRWMPGTLGAIAAWYLALVLSTVIG